MAGMAATAFMAVAVTQVIAVEVMEVAVVVKVLIVARIGSVIAVPRIKAVVHMAVEIAAAVVPGTGADKHAVREPLRTVVAVRSAAIGRIVVVTIGADGRGTNLYAEADLSCVGRRNCGQHCNEKCRQ